MCVSKYSLAIVALISMTAASSTSQAQVNTQRGATIGGIAGAAIGTAIGDHNGEAGAGAAIGGVLGAVTGGLLGNANDKQAAIDRQNYYYQQQQRQYAQQQQQMIQRQAAVSITDVVSMSRTGLSDNVIINQVNERGFSRKLTVPDIIALHQQGVSEHVITALQTAPSSPRIAQARPVVVQQPIIERRVITPAPVIIQEHHVVPHYGRHHYHYHQPTPRHRSSFNIRF